MWNRVNICCKTKQRNVVYTMGWCVRSDFSVWIVSVCLRLIRLNNEYVPTGKVWKNYVINMNLTQMLIVTIVVVYGVISLLLYSKNPFYRWVEMGTVSVIRLSVSFSFVEWDEFKKKLLYCTHIWSVNIREWKLILVL